MNEEGPDQSGKEKEGIEVKDVVELRKSPTKQVQDFHEPLYEEEEKWELSKGEIRTPIILGKDYPKNPIDSIGKIAQFYAF